MTTERDVYHNELRKLGHGLPIYEPDPALEYDKIRVGDVGYVDRFGYFHRVFNAFLPRDHAINQQQGTPEDFVPLPERSHATFSRSPLPAGAMHSAYVRVLEGSFDVSGSCIPANATIRFSVSNKQGAALVIKYPAFREDTRYEKILKDYILQHYRSWITFMRDDLECLINLPDIVLVTGCDLTANWATAAFVEKATQCEIEFKAGDQTPSASGSAAFWGTWQSSINVPHRCGPVPVSPEIANGLSSNRSTNPVYNQCIFVRGFRVKERSRLLPPVIRAAAEPRDYDSARDADSIPRVLALECNSDSDDSLSDSGRSMDESLLRSAASVINNMIFDYIFEKTDANLAVIHDNDICQIVKANTRDEPFDEFLQQSQPDVELYTNKFTQSKVAGIARDKFNAIPENDVFVDSYQDCQAQSDARSSLNTSPHFISDANKGRNEKRVEIESDLSERRTTWSSPAADGLNPEKLESATVSSPTAYSELAFTPSLAGFDTDITEKVSHKSPRYAKQALRNGILQTDSELKSELVYQHNVSTLMAANARPFSISGRIPLDSKHLIVFFRSQSGMTNALDFPIDVEVKAPPSLDVLIAACKPHATCELDGFSDRESLFYPPNLSLTTTLELASHPILDVIRKTLFPRLTAGQYLVVVQDVMQLVPTGGHMCPQRRLTQEEGKVATLIVTLPSRFRGGALVVRDLEGNEEKYYGRGGKPGDLEWTAFLADYCEHEVETVHRGVRLTIAYNVFMRTFGSSPSPSQSLVVPSDRFLDLIAPILNASRGQHIAFYLREQYGYSPAGVLAEYLVPNLKGGDAILYHALRLYKLAPELRWAAGGYIWPADSTVERGTFFHYSQRSRYIRGKVPPAKASIPPNGRTQRSYVSMPRTGNVYGSRNDQFSLSTDSRLDPTFEDEADEAARLRGKLEESGAVLIASEGIKVLPDTALGAGDSVTKVRVPYIPAEGLEKLIINVLLVVYVS